MWENNHQPARALAAWENVLISPPLRLLPLADARGTPELAGDRAAAAARRLVAASGSGLAADVERRAHEVWDGVPPGERPEAARRLVATFPHAALTPVALREAATQLERANRPAAAADCWRQLLALAPEGPERATALAALAARRPGQAPAPTQRLSLPLRRAWHASLGPGETFLPGPDPGTCPALVLTGRPDGEIIARPFGTGEVAWRCRLPITPCWADVADDLVLAAGGDGVAALRRDDGAVAWTFRPGGAGFQPASSLMAGWKPAPRGGLAGFQVACGRLFCFDGGLRLYALDTQTGRALWAHDAPGAPLLAREGRFFPAFTATGSAVVLQTAGGRYCILDPASGRMLGGGPASTQPWPCPPPALDQRSLLLVPDTQAVLSLSVAGGMGEPVWRYALEGRTTGTGEFPRVLAAADGLLVVSPLNIGLRLDRLDRDTGKVSWQQPYLLSDARLDAGGWAAGREAAFYTGEATLSARSLVDGRVLWQRPLPPGWTWAVRDVGEALLVYPDLRPSTDCRFPCPGGSLQYLAGPPLAPGYTFPVLVCDPRTGQMIQRLNLPCRPRAGVRLGTGRAFTVWTGPASPPPDSGTANAEVYAGPAGVLVALAGDLWALTRDRP
jgi:outer membrane protein assembly factor BamB